MLFDAPLAQLKQDISSCNLMSGAPDVVLALPGPTYWCAVSGAVAVWL